MLQTRDNKRAMLAFKKQVADLLTGFELKALRQRLGVIQAQAAVIFGGGPVAFSKYESDDVMQ
jgi:HTH-type transcriptional regulator/antitoxin MqsA